MLAQFVFFNLIMLYELQRVLVLWNYMGLSDSVMYIILLYPEGGGGAGFLFSS